MSSLEVPQTQSTAPVFEYHCLFTSDLRRKQKRWQDGQLKFHTFNNRVMVYDDRSNFVGDTHWREDRLNEGEELELERRGILVEVGECHGQRNQDLSDLVDKPRKEKEDRAAARAAAASPALRDDSKSPGSELSRPKPLNRMLTPSGRYGRATIPNISPFEEKQRQSGPKDENDRPTKRRKTDDNSSKNGYAQNLMGASLNLSSSRPSSTPVIRYEPLKLKSVLVRRPETTIDLTSDSDNDRNVGARQGDAKDGAPLKQPTSNVRKRDKRTSVAKNGYASNLTGAALSLARPADVILKQTSKPLQARKSLTPIESEESGSSIVEDVTMADSPIPGRRALLANSEKPVSNRTVESLDLNAVFDVRSSSPATFDENTAGSSPAKTVPSPQRRMRKASQPKTRNSDTGHELPARLPKVTTRKVSMEILSSKQTGVRSSSVDESGSAKATSSLRIKSRPSRKMMMLMDKPSSHQSLASGCDMKGSRSKNSSKPAANEIILSQGTLQLDSFRQKQEERLEARLKGKHSKFDYNDLLDSPPDSGINHRTIDVLSRKSGLGTTEIYEIHHPATEGATRTLESASKAKQSLNIDTDKGQDSDLLDFPGHDKSPSGIRTLSTASPDPVSQLPDNGLRDLAHLAPTTSADKSPDRLPPPEGMARSPTSVADEMLNNIEPLLGNTNSHAPSFSKALSSANTSPPSKAAMPKSARTGIDTSQIPDLEEAIASLEKDEAGPTKDLRSEPPSHIKYRLDVNGRTDSADYSKQKEAQFPATYLTGYTIDQVQHEKDLLENGRNYRDENTEALVSERHTKTPRNESLRANGLPMCMTSVIQGSKEHFREGLNTSQNQLRENVGPDVAESHNTGMAQEPRIKYSATSEIELVSNPLMIKPSPKPTLVDLSILDNVDSLRLGGMPLVREDLIPLTPQPAVVELRNAERLHLPAVLLAPKPKVANPATRGKSLQAIAAVSADFVAPAFNALMPQPAPRPLSRINKTNPRENAMTGREHAAPTRDECKSGPWSRESFDLFGTWKPPERKTGVNVTAA